jgi:hypothetical protein
MREALPLKPGNATVGFDVSISLIMLDKSTHLESLSYGRKGFPLMIIQQSYDSQL